MISDTKAYRESRPAGMPLLQRLRSISIGAKFASAVVTTVGILALMVGFGLTRFATRHLVQAKLRGSEVVVDGVAETLAPALDFADDAGVTECAERLSRTRDVGRVIVWNQTSTEPVYRRPADVLARAPMRDETRESASELVLTRLLKNPLGQQVGRLEVAFSLRPEASYSLHLRSRILGVTGFLAVVVAGLIIVIARYAIVLRLEQLLSAMLHLRNGQQVAVDASTRDEIGALAQGFNEMALAIRDREQKLGIERDKSQELLDNMRQAILVVGEGGRVLDVRSRQAEVIFASRLKDAQIWTLLCDESRPVIERQALREWVETAFIVGPAHWAELSKLAPTEAIVTGQDNETHILTIETRPIVLDGKLVRIMLLCTDVTAQREFEKVVQEREAEHDRQMRVMRRLIAGTGFQLIATLRTIEEKIATCERILGTPEITPGDTNELFQIVHSIKGDASAFELDQLVQTSTALEAELGNLRVETLQGVSFSKIWVQAMNEGTARIAGALKATRRMVAAASPLGEEILDLVTVRRTDLLRLKTLCADSDQRIRDAVSRTLAQHFGPLVQNLASACERWAESLSKKAVLEVHGHDVLVPDELARVLPGVLTQLVRNCISHGIESPEERVTAGKPETGRIELRCVSRGDAVEIHISDDGRGLNEAQLLAHLHAMGKQVSPEEAVFEPGVTTADDSTIQAGIAGRGVGLGGVRAELAEVGYLMRLNSAPQRGLDVQLYRPASVGKREAAT